MNNRVSVELQQEDRKDDAATLALPYLWDTCARCGFVASTRWAESLAAAMEDHEVYCAVAHA